MLAFYDPDAAMQMDPEIFPSLHLGQTEMLPVCAADAEGKPLFDLEGDVSVPLLAYSAGAFLGRSVNGFCVSVSCALPPSMTAMADSLKSMALKASHRLGAATERARRAGLRRTGGPRRPAMACAAGNSPVPLRTGAQGQRTVALAQT
jgi:hypothetical protein